MFLGEICPELWACVVGEHLSDVFSGDECGFQPLYIRSHLDKVAQTGIGKSLINHMVHKRQKRCPVVVDIQDNNRLFVQAKPHLHSERMDVDLEAVAKPVQIDEDDEDDMMTILRLTPRCQRVSRGRGV